MNEQTWQEQVKILGTLLQEYAQLLRDSAQREVPQGMKTSDLAYARILEALTVMREEEALNAKHRTAARDVGSDAASRQEEVRPCPFCGSWAYLALDGDVYCVECEACGVHGPKDVDAQVALADWNRRSET